MTEQARLPINVEVGKRLRARRRQLGVSQQEVADAIGVAAQQVQKYEVGSNALNVQRLCDFGKALRVPVAYFFAEIDPHASKASKADIKEQLGIATDREAIEALKSFRMLKSRPMRKRLADLMRTLALEEAA